MSSGNLGAIFGGGAFDATQVEPMSDFQVLPPGKYQVVIQKAELRITKAQTGRYIWLEMAVVNHETLNNRKLWCNINVSNPNSQCQQMGLALLSALARAANIPQVVDTSQLVGASVTAHVKVKDDQNNVRTFSPVGDAGAGVGQSGPPVAAPTPVQPNTVVPAVPAQPAQPVMPQQTQPTAAPVGQPTAAAAAPPTLPWQKPQ